MAKRCGANTAVPEWRERLVCSACGSRNVDMVELADSYDRSISTMRRSTRTA
jgi:hypothetical protein